MNTLVYICVLVLNSGTVPACSVIEVPRAAPQDIPEFCMLATIGLRENVKDNRLVRCEVYDPDKEYAQ